MGALLFISLIISGVLEGMGSGGEGRGWGLDERGKWIGGVGWIREKGEMREKESYLRSSRRRIPSFILLSCRRRRRRGSQRPPLPLPFGYLRARVLCRRGGRGSGTDDAARGGEVVGFVGRAGAEVAHFLFF